MEPETGDYFHLQPDVVFRFHVGLFRGVLFHSTFVLCTSKPSKRRGRGAAGVPSGGAGEAGGRSMVGG